MKKSLSLILVCSLFVSLLVGCSTTKPIDVVEPSPVIVDGQPNIVDEVSLKAEHKGVHFKYSESDEIIELLEKSGYKMDEGYMLYPNSEFYYPEYIQSEDGLVVAYLNEETLRSYDEFALYEDDLTLIFESTKGDLYSSSTNSMSGFISGITNAVDSIFSGSDGLGSATTGVTLNESYSMYPMEEFGSDFNTSEYKEVEESNYLSVLTSPLSTFAADVDTASYTNFRSILRNILWPDNMYFNDNLHDIRVEEVMNYFDYNFSNGKEYINDKFAISAEIGDTPWNEDSKLMVVNIKAKELDAIEKKGSNLVFLIDTSGSMDSVEKMGLLIKSLKLLVEELTENDTVSIVTYASNDRVIIEGVKGSDKDTIIEALDELVVGGSTNGEGGIKRAYKIAQKYMDGHSNSRVIMCSDGDLNVGISSENELIDLIEEKRETGVYLSVLGFGSGNYKDNKMEALANNGNGNYYYIDSLKEGYKVLVEDLSSTLITIADDVKFQLEFNPEYVKGYRKIGYENRNMANEDFHDDTKDGGEVGYGHEVTVVYELVMTDSAMDVGTSNLKYQENTTVGSTDWLTVSIRYKNHGASESELIEYIVDADEYLTDNSTDWHFVSDIVGFSLIANHSEYVDDLSINDILADLQSIELADIDKQEFLGLVIGYQNYLDIVEDEVEDYFEDVDDIMPYDNEDVVAEPNSFLGLAGGN